MLKRFCAIAAVLGVTFGTSLHAQSSAFAVDFIWQGTGHASIQSHPRFHSPAFPVGRRCSSSP
jgi:hypothetical protein